MSIKRLFLPNHSKLTRDEIVRVIIHKVLLKQPKVMKLWGDTFLDFDPKKRQFITTTVYNYLSNSFCQEYTDKLYELNSQGALWDGTLEQKVDEFIFAWVTNEKTKGLKKIYQTINDKYYPGDKEFVPRIS